MCGTVNLRDTIIIFYPFCLTNIHRCYMLGDFAKFDDYVKIFFITLQFEPNKSNSCVSLFSHTTWDGGEASLKLQKNWVLFEIINNVLILRELTMEGKSKELNNYHIIWINYDFNVFSQCEISSVESYGPYSDKSYFKYFKEMIQEKIERERKRKVTKRNITSDLVFSLLSKAVLKLSRYNMNKLFVSKYFNVALHTDNYLKGFVWVVNYVRDKQKLDVKVINFILSVFLDMLLGIFFLKWLNSKVSLDAFSTLFLFTTESVVNSIRDLINWLRGDPAGLKLNWAFNNVLAIFFSFYIDIWWTFIAYINPLVKIIFQIFLQIGLLGITFQASITADLLALVTFHVYCIYAYAAKLYSIQISTLISLWRLFLGQKKNPLRGKVDSCRYSPEQLFVGTLGFTILLFLLPTTLLYYIVFTSIRLSILTVQAILMLIRFLNQALPVYSTILWLLRSPKISAGIEIVPYSGPLKSNVILVSVKPVTYSWWETVCYFMPDCAPKPGNLNVSKLLNSLISGKLIFPI